MTLNIALSFVLGSGIIFTKFDLLQLICAWIIAFFDADTLCHAGTLTFGPLTLKVCGTSHITWSKSVRAIPGWITNNSNFCTRHVTLWPWPLTSWPWTFMALLRLHHAFKLCTKSERKRIIHGWDIDDLARFHVQF